METESAAPSGPHREAVEPHLPRCGCGHDRTHTMVSPSAEYTMLGWAFILVGVSWEPTAISFVCRTCNQVVERVVDPKEMATIRLAG